MKLLLIALLFVTAACNNSSVNISKPADSSSVSFSDSGTQQVDSATLSQQKIAYGSIRFGMTKKEYDKLPYAEKSTGQKIGSFDYTIWPSFDKKGKLYMLTIDGLSRTANYIDTYVRQSTDNITEVIASKYGPGNFIRTFPSIFDFQPGYIVFTTEWTIGKKIIKVGAGEESAGSTYYSHCRIYDKELNEAEIISEQQKADTVKSSDANKF